MRKKTTVLFTTIYIIMALTGCGANFNVSDSELKTYAENNAGVFTDISDNYGNVEQIEGCYVTEVDGVHVELWDFDSTENAGTWFNSNLADIKEDSSSFSGSTSKSSGDYSVTKNSIFYRLMYCNEIGIWAEGNDKDAVNKVLAELNIIKK